MSGLDFHAARLITAARCSIHVAPWIFHIRRILIKVRPPGQ